MIRGRRLAGGGRRLRPVAGALALQLAAGCAQPQPSAATYTPRTREITITTIPLITKELQSVYPFLKQDFAKGGVLDGKEVYGFLPSSITVVEGDTIHFTFINPEDDVHSFVLPDLAVALRGFRRRNALREHT